MKRRFVQSRDPPYDFFEVTDDYVPSTRAVDRYVSDAYYDGARATDGTDISTRAKHREYMKANGLTTADDFKDTWSKAAEQRAEFFTKGPKGIRTDIERAIHQLENKR